MPNTVTEILFKDQFWWGVWLVLCVLIYFTKRRNPPPFPRAREFFTRHKGNIVRICDVLLICLILLWSLFPLYFAKEALSTLWNSESAQSTLLQADLPFLFTSLIVWSGMSGFFVGLLSVFQSTLTRAKRIILLAICLLPVVFTLLLLLTLSEKDVWVAIQLCFYYSIAGWIVNIPGVLTGRNSFQLLGDGFRKLKSVFRNRPG